MSTSRIGVCQYSSLSFNPYCLASSGDSVRGGIKSAPSAPVTSCRSTYPRFLPRVLRVKMIAVSDGRSIQPANLFSPFSSFSMAGTPATNLRKLLSAKSTNRSRESSRACLNLESSSHQLYTDCLATPKLAAISDNMPPHAFATCVNCLIDGFALGYAIFYSVKLVKLIPPVRPYRRTSPQG